MKKYSHIQYVELFHLIFLDLLGRKLDRRFYCLKGGCNLRFFLKSRRYSEDMDLDATGISKDNLEDIVGAVLKSATMKSVLKVNGISMTRWSSPKQTETTQRWKFLIHCEGLTRELNVKVEFSRLEQAGDMAFEPVDPLIAREYSLPETLVNHYTLQAAFEQKIAALATRKTTQARDVFDLSLLLSSGADPARVSGPTRQMFTAASENAFSVPFAVFRSQVLSYLHPDERTRHDSEDTWEGVVLRIAESLERGRRT